MVPAVGEHAPVVGQGGGHEALGVTEVGGPSGGVEEGVAEGGVAGLALGGAEPDGQVDAQDRIGVVGLGVEVEGLGVVARGRRRGRAQRARRRRPGASSRGPWRGRSGWEALNQWRASSPTRDPGRSPQRSSSASATWRWARARRVRPEVLVQRVLDEGVGEAVVPRGVGELAHQGRGGRRVEDVEQRRRPTVSVARASRSRSKSRPITAASDNTRSASASQPPDTGADHRADAGRQRHLRRAASAATQRPVARPGRSPRSRRGGGAPRSRRTGCRRSRDAPPGRDARPASSRVCPAAASISDTTPVSSSPANSMRATPRVAMQRGQRLDQRVGA